MAKIETVRVIKPASEYIGTAVAAPESLVRRIEAMVRMAGSAEGDTLSPIAKMRMRGQIPGHYFAAVEKLQRQRRAYLRAIDAKGIKSPSAEQVGKAEPPDPYSEIGLQIGAREERAIKEYDRSMRVIAECGRRDAEPFRAYVLAWPEGDEGSAPADVVASVRVVAKALHEHFSLSRRRAQREKRG